MTYRTLLIVILVYLQTFSVFAHGGEARIELNVTQASPGATIDVRGTGFAPLEMVAFKLVKSGVQVQIGDFEADIEGDFAFRLLLPFDLEYGEYQVQAADTHHSASVPLSIVPDRSGEEEAGQREEEDSLLAPMPTLGPGVSSTPLPQTTALELPASKESSRTLIYSILLGIGIMALVGLRIFKKR